jgi:sortase (surface protein transpeptidase)
MGRAIRPTALGLLTATLVLGSTILIGGPDPGVDPAPPEEYDVTTAAGPAASARTTSTAAPAAPAVELPLPVSEAGVATESAEEEEEEEFEAPSPLPPATIVSGRLEDRARQAERAIPVRLRIPVIGVDAPIAPGGYHEGEMEVPTSADVVGWYRFGPAPGESGSAVLAAHVDWGGRAGAFFSLRDLPPGAAVEVDFDDGSTLVFRAATLTSYGKDDLPVDRLFARDGTPTLTLITCGGAFNPSLRSYEDNVVAMALPASPVAGAN